MLDPTLGLALGGGGALGAAHVGVLKALGERRLRPGIVAGTSAGSLVGAAYAAGLPVARIERGEPLIEDLPRQFAAIATDLRSRQQIVFSEGPLGPALRASIAVPGLFAPVITPGRVLVDGGLAANLPIGAARSLGATRVIAVRLRPEWERVPVVRSAESIARMEHDPDVFMIRPDLSGMSQWSRDDVPKLIDAGYRAAARALDETRA